MGTHARAVVVKQDRTPEQVAADDNLLSAIQQAMTAWGQMEDHEHVDRFVVVVTTVKADDPEYESYGMLFPAGAQPTYVTLGLLEVGAQIIDPRFQRVAGEDEA